MSALVKKEIRLLLPSWIVAMLLALPPVCTRSDDGIPVFLLFFGMAMMALTSIGRETSLNTFSQLLAQPAERMRIWQTKLLVLVAAFLSVFAVWRLATIFSFKDYGGSIADPEATEAVLVAGCMVVVATFSGGLWATLLLRQIAGAFWLTLLVPATLAGFTAAFLSESQPDSGVIAALCVIIGIYSVGGFLFARWLFFRAQDVGWTGGIISLPQWKFFSTRSESAEEVRNRKPIFALLKKEFQLQHVSLMGAAGLLVLHIGVIVLRTHHQFAKDSAGDVLTSIFWMLWLVLPVLVGAMSVAEERRLGVMEGQLCLPASRRVQFIIKGFLTLSLGIFLGGIMPCLLETVAIKIGLANGSITQDKDVIVSIEARLAIIGLSLSLTLVSFFASSLAKNFLQAIGFAIATFIGFAMIIPAFAKGRMIFFDSMPTGSVLPLLIAVPTLIFTLLLLAYLNFKNFRDGWHLWQRNFLGLVGAIIFIIASSTALYNRAWEVFEPAEPAHGPAKLSLANPPKLQMLIYDNLLVRLPDGRVWFNSLEDFGNSYEPFNWKSWTKALFHPLPTSAGPQKFIAGSNWVAAATGTVYLGERTLASGNQFHSWGNLGTAGIQSDGTLWASGKPAQGKWMADAVQRFGSESNWQQLAVSRSTVVLLKSNGTLWSWGLWGTNTNGWGENEQEWPGLRAFEPQQIGTNSDWQELFNNSFRPLARQTNGHVWVLDAKNRNVIQEMERETNYDEVVSQSASHGDYQQIVFVRTNGTLWTLNRYWDTQRGRDMGIGVLQVGRENDWRAVAMSYHMMVALKADGSLWEWELENEAIATSFNVLPTRLGIHSDWVGIINISGGVIACAADGSLWFWPDKKFYDYGILMKLPKQPQFLGNVFGNSN